VGDLAPGSVLGGCRLDAILGRGGMGVVYRARQLDLDRDVAVKVIAPEMVEEPHTRERFLAEARAGGAVEHPTVVPVHGAGIADGHAYLIMRYVPGEDLHALVRAQGPLSPASAARIAMRLGAALDAIHSAGYVHRDVKPRNILLDEAGHVYLSDFGLAKHALAAAGPTRPDQWVGTLDFAAPEQIRGEPVDARADVYALGGVLHFMLTGRVPFEREGAEAKLWAHLNDPPPHPSAVRPGVPVAFDAVVQRALAKEPAVRQPSAGDLGRAARAAAGGGGDTSRERTVARGAAAPAGPRSQTTLSSPPRPRGGSGTRGRRRLVLAAAPAALVAAAVGLVLVVDDRGDGSRRPAPARTATPSATPAGPRVGATIENVGFRPRDVAVANGHVWVISISEPRITRIEAATGRRRGDQPRVGRGASSIAAHGDDVWVSVPERGEVLRLNEGSGRVVGRVTTPLRPVLVAAGRSGLWVAGRAEAADGADALLHYDRAGERLLHRIDVPDGIRAITLGRGSAWMALAREARIVRVSPDGDTRHAGWLTGEPASRLAYGAGHLWASLTDADAVARVDPLTGLAPETEIGRRPAHLTVAGGRLFVASYTDHTVRVLDPETLRPIGTPLAVPLNPLAVAAGAGHVWVTGLGANTLTRIDY